MKVLCHGRVVCKRSRTRCEKPTRRRAVSQHTVEISHVALTRNFAKKAVALTQLRTTRCCSNATSHNSPLRCSTARCHVHTTLLYTPLCQRKYAQLAVTQHAHTLIKLCTTCHPIILFSYPHIRATVTFTFYYQLTSAEGFQYFLIKIC